MELTSSLLSNITASSKTCPPRVLICLVIITLHMKIRGVVRTLAMITGIKDIYINLLVYLVNVTAMSDKNLYLRFNKLVHLY